MVTMSSLPSPLTYSHSRARCLRFLSSVSLSLPIFHNFKTRPKLFTKSPNPLILTVRNCGSITAKPSSDITRKNRGGSEPDEKLRRLRELFVKPGIDIDAYIVPSQDAHQVVFFHWFWVNLWLLWFEFNWVFWVLRVCYGHLWFFGSVFGWSWIFLQCLVLVLCYREVNGTGFWDI